MKATKGFELVELIDLRHKYPSPGLYARIVMQALFREYRKIAKDSEHLDNLFCDYDTLREEFEECMNWSQKEVRLYWEPWETGGTSIRNYSEEDKNEFEILYVPGKDPHSIFISRFVSE